MVFNSFIDLDFCFGDVNVLIIYIDMSVNVFVCRLFLIRWKMKNVFFFVIMR